MTQVSNGIYGWKAETYVPLVDGKEGDGDKVLCFTTMKRSSGKISTVASVLTIEGKFMSCAVFQDFSKTVHVSTQTRATEKAIRSAHEEALNHKAATLKAAREHYHLET